MDPIERLVVALGVDVDQSSLNRAKSGFGSLVGVMGRVAQAGAAVAGALIGVTVESAKAGDRAAKTARTFGLTADELTELEFAADRSGVAVNAIRSGLRGLQRNAEDFARSGGGEAADAFRQMGISVQDVQKLRAPELLERIAQGFVSLEGTALEGRREALVQRIFGGRAQEFVNLLSAGGDGIRDLRREARLYFATISREDAEASEEFVDSLTNLGSIIPGLARRLGFALLPRLQSVVDSIDDWFVANRDVILSGFDRFVERLGDVLDNLNTPLGRTVGLIGALAAIRSIPFLGPLLGALARFALPLAIISAVAIVIEDLLTFMEGGDSVIGRVADSLGIDLAGSIISAAEAAQDLWDWMSALFDDVFGDAAKKITDVDDPMGGLLKTLREVGSVVGSGIWDTLFPPERLEKINLALDRIRTALEFLNDYFGFTDKLRAGFDFVVDRASTGAEFVIDRASTGAAAVLAGDDRIAPIVDEALFAEPPPRRQRLIQAEAEARAEFGRTSVNFGGGVTINVTQDQGESSEQFAQRIARVLEKRALQAVQTQ